MEQVFPGGRERPPPKLAKVDPRMFRAPAERAPASLKNAKQNGPPTEAASRHADHQRLATSVVRPPPGIGSVHILPRGGVSDEKQDGESHPSRHSWDRMPNTTRQDGLR